MGDKGFFPGPWIRKCPYCSPYVSGLLGLLLRRLTCTAFTPRHVRMTWTAQAVIDTCSAHFAKLSDTMLFSSVMTNTRCAAN